MGTCKFCGQKAGFLQSAHKECKAIHEKGKTELVDKISQAIVTTTDFPAFDTEINSIAQKAFVRKEEMNSLYSKGFDTAIESFLDDGVITPEEEQRVADFKKYYNFDDAILDKNGSLQKIVKALILRDILNGKIPSRLNISGTLPFLLQKEETMIWIFQNVEFYEQRTKTTYQGSSSGVSMRIAKGVYYRTGSFRGNPVVSQEMTLLGNGILAFTNKHLYFGSTAKTFKIPYHKIVAVNPYSDGIGIQKDGVSAKPQVFKQLDGWFAYNLISNLNQL